MSKRYEDHLTRLRFDPDYAAKHAAKRKELNERYRLSKRAKRADPVFRADELQKARENRALRAKRDPMYLEAEASRQRRIAQVKRELGFVPRETKVAE